MKKVDSNKLKKVKLINKLDERRKGEIIETSEKYANYLIDKKIAQDIKKKKENNDK